MHLRLDLTRLVFFAEFARLAWGVTKNVLLNDIPFIFAILYHPAFPVNTLAPGFLRHFVHIHCAVAQMSLYCF